MLRQLRCGHDYTQSQTCHEIFGDNTQLILSSWISLLRRFWTVGWSRIVLERPTQVVDTLMGSGGIIL